MSPPHLRSAFVVMTAALLARAEAAPIPDTAGAAPLSVGVDAPEVTGSFLQPYDNVWRFGVTTVADGVYHFQGLWTDHLQRLEKDGRPLLQRTQGFTYVDGRVTSVVNVFDPRNMAPVSSEQRDPDGSFQHRDFSAGKMAFRRTPAGGKEERGELRLSAPVFDFAGGMYGLLLDAFPLRAGYAATIPTVDEHESTIVPVTFRVLRRETVTAGRLGRREAWVVERRDEASHQTMTFWLSREAPYVLELTITGPRGNIASWEML